MGSVRLHVASRYLRRALGTRATGHEGGRLQGGGGTPRAQPAPLRAPPPRPRACSGTRALSPRQPPAACGPGRGWGRGGLRGAWPSGRPWGRGGPRLPRRLEKSCPGQSASLRGIRRRRGVHPAGAGREHRLRSPAGRLAPGGGPGAWDSRRGPRAGPAPPAGGGRPELPGRRMRSEGAAPGRVAPPCRALSLVLAALLGRGKRPGAGGVGRAGAREVPRGPQEPGWGEPKGEGVAGTWVRALAPRRGAAPSLGGRAPLGAASVGLGRNWLTQCLRVRGASRGEEGAWLRDTPCVFTVPEFREDLEQPGTATTWSWGAGSGQPGSLRLLPPQPGVPLPSSVGLGLVTHEGRPGPLCPVSPTVGSRGPALAPEGMRSSRGPQLGRNPAPLRAPRRGPVWSRSA